MFIQYDFYCLWELIIRPSQLFANRQFRMFDSQDTMSIRQSLNADCKREFIGILFDLLKIRSFGDVNLKGVRECIL